MRSVTAVRANPDVRGGHGLVTCAELARLEVFGGCPAGEQVAEVPVDLIGMNASDLADGDHLWEAAGIAAGAVDQQPILSIVVNTTSPAALEQARTILIRAFPQGRFPARGVEWQAESARQLVQFQQLANVVILASLPIAGCSLAVSVVGGLSDRKRPFSMLRLTGVRLRTLRGVVALETVVPLLIVAAVAIGMGFLAAHLFLQAQLEYTLVAPKPSFYLMVVGGLAVSLAIIGSTLPLLRRITGPETARNG